MTFLALPRLTCAAQADGKVDLTQARETASQSELFVNLWEEWGR